MVRMWKYYLVSFFWCCLLGAVIVGSFLAYSVYVKKKQAAIAASYTMYQIRYILVEKINKTEALSALILSDDEKMMRQMYDAPFALHYREEFNIFCKKFRDSNAIRAFQLLPKGIVTYTYPYESNKSSIGDNVLIRKERREDAIKAMNSKKMRISGPLNLKQGGQALIARNPLYFKDGTFWGFAVIILDLPDILVPLGLDTLSI